MSYYFFLSYAKETGSLPLLRKFFDDLSADVASLARWSQPRAGFMDHNQRRGEEWDDKIAVALATAKVMVCIYTPTYFGKPYCGKEVAVMLRRRHRYQATQPATRPRSIIPVLWDPCIDPISGRDFVARTLPPFFVSRDERSVYESEGLRFMLEAGSYQAECVALRRSIARDILANASQFQLPDEPLPLSMATVPNAFVPQPTRLVPETITKVGFGPASVLCLVVGPTDWQLDTTCPFRPPEEDGAAYVCAAITERLESQARELGFDPQSMAATDAIAHIAKSNGRVLVIVDPRVLETEPYAAWLRAYDEREFHNCATIVAGAVTPAQLLRTFPVQSARRPQLLHAPARAGALAGAVETSLQLLHDALASGSDAVAPLQRATVHASVPSLALPAA